MDSREKALIATLFIVSFLIVVLSLTLAPTWLMAFLILFGGIALAVCKEKKERTNLPIQAPAHVVSAPGQAVNASVGAPVRHSRGQSVIEEVELAILHSHDRPVRAPSNPVGTSEASRLRLQFVTELPNTIFTNSQIKAVGNTPLKIELVDGRTNDKVTSGRLSSIYIEIVVLDGGSDMGDDWTEEEFNCNITRGRGGGKPLIIGELAVALQEGIACFDNLSITDHSKWTRSKKFRLGARAAQEVSVETRIREARSEAFTVRSHPGEKHHPPSLSDKVWCLENVSRDGTAYERLASQGINTVQDFLQLYEADAPF